MSYEGNFNKQKFKDVLSYIINKCENKKNAGNVVIYKLLYFSDFNFYEIYERPLANETYLKHENGPFSMHFDEITNEMVKNNELNIKNEDTDFTPTKYYLLNSLDISNLTNNEINVINGVIDKLGDYSASEINDYSHRDTPWAVAENNEVLDYEFVFYRDEEYSVRNYNE